MGTAMSLVSQSDTLRHMTESLAPVLALAFVIALVAWIRYLHHKETMRTLELGGDARAGLELGERWRARSGMVAGAVMMVLGILVSIQYLLMSLNRVHLSSPEDQAIQLAANATAVLGFVVLVAYALWSGQQTAAGRPEETEGERERLRIRLGLCVGVLLAAAGTGCVSALIAGLCAGDKGATAILLGIGLFLFVGGVAIVALHTIWSRELHRERSRVASEDKGSAVDRSDQSAQ
jgi:hypothetical protein